MTWKDWERKGQQIIDHVRQAWRDGRGIVPVLGGGLSAEAGVPTLEGLVSYLARLRLYVHERVYLPECDAHELDVVGAAADRYRHNPSHFVQEHGWPDLFQLNEELGRHLGRTGRAPR
jgi:hypothetical protein